jgi:hypothetical protein
MSAIPNNRRPRSFYEANARERIAGLLDPGSFREFVGPRQRAMSPHLAQLDQPGAFDDGIVVGEGRLDGRTVLIAAQQGRFMGGAVGEVHGAKLVGLFKVLGGDEHRRSTRGGGSHPLPQPCARAGVEPGCGLVENQHRRRRDEAKSEVEAPAHSAGVG